MGQAQTPVGDVIDDKPKIMSPPIEVKKFAQGDQMVIAFTWDVVSVNKQTCSLAFVVPLGLWDDMSAKERREYFSTDVRNRCFSSHVPEHLQEQIFADCSAFADAYDWDTDRKVILSNVDDSLNHAP